MEDSFITVFTSKCDLDRRGKLETARSKSQSVS